MAPHKHQEKHFFYIEMVGYWQVHLAINELSDTFAVSRQRGSEIFKHYREAHPDNFYQAGNRWFANSEFSCHYINKSPHQYLNWLLGNTAFSANTYRPQHPARNIDADILRDVSIALTRQQAVDIRYTAMKGKPEERLISPQTLVFAAGRWHIRAWCFMRSEYRDFVLTRITDAEIDDLKSCHDLPIDHHWQEQVDIILAPDPRLDALRQQLIADEYAMIQGRLTLSVKRAMVTYQLHEMGISFPYTALSEIEQQLVIVNKSDVEAWCF
ncbi:helix-turn-helix transcriptional regulator [Thaumasiovibrio subtropicus]|uniref:helix-turn-helix transcriptional regulator n=1 Tax=Thaumasiovibrio subtropicus TaxID=1891207 RepID=UPI000B3514FD|nr:WYL domain-containing protein [Thaumasiovibrio subtropicus]